MVICPECGEEVSEKRGWECPFCGSDDFDEAYYVCEDCEILLTEYGDYWECPHCADSSLEGNIPEFLYYGDDEDCEDENPDVNQGWVGEHYGNPPWK